MTNPNLEKNIIEQTTSLDEKKLTPSSDHEGLSNLTREVTSDSDQPISIAQSSSRTIDQPNSMMTQHTNMSSRTLVDQPSLSPVLFGFTQRGHYLLSLCNLSDTENKKLQKKLSRLRIASFLNIQIQDLYKKEIENLFNYLNKKRSIKSINVKSTKKWLEDWKKKELDLVGYSNKRTIEAINSNHTVNQFLNLNILDNDFTIDGVGSDIVNYNDSSVIYSEDGEIRKKVLNIAYPFMINPSPSHYKSVLPWLLAKEKNKDSKGNPICTPENKHILNCEEV